MTQFKVDTGASISIMSSERFKTLFPSTKLGNTSMKVVSYTGEPIKLAGEVRIPVTWNGYTKMLTQYIFQRKISRTLWD